MDDGSDSDKFQIACFVDSSGPTFQLWPMGMNYVRFRPKPRKQAKMSNIATKSKHKTSNIASKKLAKYREKWRVKTRMRSEQKRELEASKNANEKRAKRDQEAS